MSRIIIVVSFIFLFRTFACAQNSEINNSGKVNYPECGNFNYVNSYVDSIAKGDLNLWVNIIDTINEIDSIESFYCRLHYIENKMLSVHGSLVNRKNEKLIFKLDNGLKKVFADKPDFPDREQYGIYYFFDKYYPEINSYLVQYYGMEFGGFKLINKTNGLMIDIPNRPIVSPDRKHFILFNVDLESEYTPNVIKIYELKNNCKVLYQDYFLKSEQNENQIKVPIEISWLSEKEIVIKQGCSNGDDFEYRYCGDYRLLFNGRWYKSK
jgi:hypothetical protein